DRAKQWLCRTAALGAATPRFARRPATPAAASSVAPIASGYERSLRPCLATPIASLRRATVSPGLLRLVEEAALEHSRAILRRKLDVARREEEDLVGDSLHPAVE